MKPGRWRALGLTEPTEHDRPAGVDTLSLLAFASGATGSDPIVNMMDAIEGDLETLGRALGADGEHALATCAWNLLRRVRVVGVLLERADGAEPTKRAAHVIAGEIARIEANRADCERDASSPLPDVATRARETLEASAETLAALRAELLDVEQGAAFVKRASKPATPPPASKADHVAVRLDAEIIARIDAAAPRIAPRGTRPTRSIALRYLVAVGLDALEAEHAKKATAPKK